MGMPYFLECFFAICFEFVSAHSVCLGLIFSYIGLQYEEVQIMVAFDMVYFGTIIRTPRECFKNTMDVKN